MTEITPPATPEAEAPATPAPALRDQAKALLARLTETYPAAFPPSSQRTIQPLMVGIHKQLLPVIREWGYDRNLLRMALALHTRQLRYQHAILHSPQRVDLQGQAAGEVRDEDRQLAQKKVEEIQARRQQARPARPERPARKPTASTASEATPTAEAGSTAEGTPATATRPARRPRREGGERRPAAAHTHGEANARPARTPRRDEQSARSERGERSAKPARRSERPQRSERPRPAPVEALPKAPEPSFSSTGEITAEALAALAAKFNTRR